ncbi:hypothetical protein GCM10027053_28660 [Intrasporangium mesophilum]
MVGQVFLVTFVALIVARFAARQPRTGTRSDAELEADEEARAAEAAGTPEAAPASGVSASGVSARVEAGSESERPPPPSDP